MAEPGVSMETEQERKLRWYLEDERVALFLQNHEFMRELQLNRDFLIALERGTLTHTHTHSHTLTHSHTHPHINKTNVT